jgi:proteasome lid subunit RPN8/RPN11
VVSGPEPAVAAMHPGPAGVSIPGAIWAAIVAHARAELPNEACGLIVGDRPAAAGGQAIRWEPAHNRAASPFRYEIDADDLLRLTIETDDADEVFWAIVHSHVASPARPSPTDIGLAFYPDSLYVLVSLHPDEADPATGEPGPRAWRIVDGAVHEVAVRVT